MLSAVDILGVNVQSASTAAVVASLDETIAAGNTMRLTFLNAHLSNLCGRDKPLRQTLATFTVLNDGVGVDIARRMLHGKPFDENLNGTDFITAFLSHSTHDLRLFLLGARPDVIAQAARSIALRWPRHQVVGFRSGYFHDDETLLLRDEIARARPSLVLVGMGNPLQEHWIAENIPAVCPCAIAVGAWFDFLTSHVPRAPVWLRRLRFEWAFRLWIEPKRLAGRYLAGNITFLARLGHAWLRSRHAGAPDPSDKEPSFDR